ncbi:MAG: GNAT family N-acetyltransferase [Chloroflexi bacterium]|nr:GNAT family N-acetyltransferase [Chloroflexota bacterium]
MESGIRPMQPDDIPAVCRLMGQLMGEEMSAADMQSRLDWVNRSPIDWLYVYEDAGQVVGVLGFRLRERLEHPSRHGEISVLVTDAVVRWQGIGRALVAFAEGLAHQHGCAGMFLVSGFKRQDEAHRFYERLGYAPTGYRFVKTFDEG